MVLDFVGGVLLTAVTVLNLSAFVNVLRVSSTAKLWIAGVAGLWIGAQVSLAAIGAFGGALGLQVPLIGIMVVLPVLATALAWRLSPAVRSALIAVPMELLIGLNIGRVFGAFFLFLAAAGRLDGPFRYLRGGETSSLVSLHCLWLLRSPVNLRVLAPSMRGMLSVSSIWSLPLASERFPSTGSSCSLSKAE